jgi:hypothetical protein
MLPAGRHTVKGLLHEDCTRSCGANELPGEGENAIITLKGILERSQHMTITIPATVVNGHLQHDQPLAELEGQRVIATLTVVPEESTNGPSAKEKPPEPATNADFDPEPPPWLEIENDVYFPMTVPEKLLEIKQLIVERGTPSIILPEELPDD